MNNSPVPFFLVTGFLGSGKTTLLKRMIDTCGANRRLGIIQNEFAPSDIDTIDLKRGGGASFEVLSINRGSVFCVCLLSDFTSSLRRFVDEYRPEAVVLEATGLADPIAIAQLLSAPELAARLYLSHVWCIADGPRFVKMLETVTRVRHQVRIADTVVVNKTDLPGYDAETVDRAIRECNPFAQVEETSYCDVDLSRLLDASPRECVAVKRAGEHARLESSGRPSLGSAVLRSTNAITRDRLERLLERWTPATARLKGFVALTDNSHVAVQSCFGDTTITPVEMNTRITEMVAMGAGVESDFFTAYDEENRCNPY